jgi:peptidyl-prolyl cis-trans isomerase B (cyclophilin B)
MKDGFHFPSPGDLVNWRGLKRKNNQEENFVLSISEVWGMKGLLMVLLSCVVALSFGSGAEAAAKTVRVKLTTTMGDIILELYPDKAPATVDNFLQYVKDGFYNGTVFHRVIDGFMIQGGGLDANLNKKSTRAAIKNEADNGLMNEPYTIAMARTSDPHSATSQFFINVNDNKSLHHRGKSASDWGYTVFGRVVQGKEVVDKIKAVPTGSQGMYENVPATPVTITGASVVSQ